MDAAGNGYRIHVITSQPQTPTELLLAWGRGDVQALAALMPLVQGELRRIARRHMARERADHTLQATALVNEAYLRLIDLKHVRWQDRGHFFAMSARLMRRILVDFARARRTDKRGGGAPRVSLDEALLVSEEPARISSHSTRRCWRLKRSIAERVRSSSCGFLGTQRRRDRRGAGRVSRYREARLAILKIVAAARNDRASGHMTPVHGEFLIPQHFFDFFAC